MHTFHESCSKQAAVSILGSDNKCMGISRKADPQKMSYH